MFKREEIKIRCTLIKNTPSPHATAKTHVSRKREREIGEGKGSFGRDHDAEFR